MDGGPVFNYGLAPERADEFGARDPHVFLHDGAYHLIYDGAGPEGWRACLATSPDLANWRRRGALLGPSDLSPRLVRDGPRWLAHYREAGRGTPSHPFRALLAEAPSPLGPWTKLDAEPTIPLLESFHFDSAAPGPIVELDGGFATFFDGASATDADVGPGTAWSSAIGLARSNKPEGPWTPDPEPLLPPSERVERPAIFRDATSGLWFLFANRIARAREGFEYGDAIVAYRSSDPTRWNPADKAVVVDRRVCRWTALAIGSPSALQVAGRLAVFYDGNRHRPDLAADGAVLKRDIGVAWLDLPLAP